MARVRQPRKRWATSVFKFLGVYGLISGFYSSFWARPGLEEMMKMQAGGSVKYMVPGTLNNTSAEEEGGLFTSDDRTWEQRDSQYLTQVRTRALLLGKLGGMGAAPLLDRLSRREAAHFALMAASIGFLSLLWMNFYWRTLDNLFLVIGHSLWVMGMQTGFNASIWILGEFETVDSRQVSNILLPLLNTSADFSNIIPSGLLSLMGNFGFSFAHVIIGYVAVGLMFFGSIIYILYPGRKRSCILSQIKGVGCDCTCPQDEGDVKCYCCHLHPNGDEIFDRIRTMSISQDVSEYGTRMAISTANFTPSTYRWIPYLLATAIYSISYSSKTFLTDYQADIWTLSGFPSEQMERIWSTTTTFIGVPGSVVIIIMLRSKSAFFNMLVMQGSWVICFALYFTLLHLVDRTEDDVDVRMSYTAKAVSCAAMVSFVVAKSNVMSSLYAVITQFYGTSDINKRVSLANMPAILAVVVSSYFGSRCDSEINIFGHMVIHIFCFIFLLSSINWGILKCPDIDMISHQLADPRMARSSSDWRAI